VTSHSKQTALAATLVVALCWLATARAASSEFFGVRARLESTSFVVELRIPVFCLRLQADAYGSIVATARLRSCEGCLEAPRARSWS